MELGLKLCRSCRVIGRGSLAIEKQDAAVTATSVKYFKNVKDLLCAIVGLL
jgi:hypothetical protein